MSFKSILGSWRGALVAAPVAIAVLAGAVQAHAADLVVLGAASLKNALDDANTAYEKKAGAPKVVVSYGASGTLAKQIEQGAPADIFISADNNWMDYVAQKNLIRPETRANLLGNRLVLVAPKDSTAKVDIKQGFDLAGLLGPNGRLAFGDPASVPAGTYGKAALQKLGVWDSVQNKLAPSADVRAALALVSRGEAPFGVVYETDAGSDPGVKVIAAFPADSYPPIIYPIAQLSASTNPAARDYLTWLRGDDAAPAFKKQGFTVLK